MSDKKTIDHSLDDGFSTYSSDGTEHFHSEIGHTGFVGSQGTRIVNHVLDDGFDVVSKDGSAESFYKDGTPYEYFGNKGSKISKDPLTGTSKYSSANNNTNSSELSGIAAVAFGGWIILVSILTLASTKYAILSIGLIILSVAGRIILNKWRKTDFFIFWMLPFTLLGWRLMVNSMWNGPLRGDLGFLAPFGVIFISIGIVASLFIDIGESFGLCFYAIFSLIVLFFSKAFGDRIPYYVIAATFIVAVIATPLYLFKKHKKMHL